MQVRILSIDGGGARAIIPATILEYIEGKLQELAKNPKVRLSDFLDFVAGTAAGAITSTMIITPDSTGKAVYSMKNIVSNLYEFGEVYYQKKDWRTLWGYRGSKYPQEAVSAKHLKFFNHWKMKDLLLPTAIPGYDILNRKPVIFTNKDGSDIHEDLLAKDVVQGSGASPAWINPMEFRDGVNKSIIVNGNVIANNPAMIAYIEAGKTPQIIDKFKRITPDNTFLISLGTGKFQNSGYSLANVKRWNSGKWFNLVTSMSIESSTIIAEYKIRNLYNSYNADNYIRINPIIRLGNSNIMDTSLENVNHLLQDAKNYIATNQSLLDDVAIHLFNQDERYSTMLF